MTEQQSNGNSWAAGIGRVAGPLLALLLWSGPWWGFHLDAERLQLNSMAAVTALMAVWWLTEAVPMAATALLPLVLFPLLKIMPGGEVARQYGHYLIFLFLGGFLIAIAIEESGLHRRVALKIIAAMGDRPRRLVWGFMAASALLSMWISNTATALMMLPIGASVLAQADRHGQDSRTQRNFSVTLMLGIAYGCSIGGVATLVGTPPNMAFAGIYQNTFHEVRPAIGFFDWMKLAVPYSMTMLVIAWFTLTWLAFPLGGDSFLGGRRVIRDELHKLGRMSAAEWRMAAIFLITALLWVFREPTPGFGWAPLLGLSESVDGKAWVNDGTSAMLMAILCFLVPSGTKPGQALLNWQATVRVPWGILLLFGGGLALAAGMGASEFDQYLGGHLASAVEPLPDAGKIAVMAFGMTWLTELTSNLASVNMIIPVLAQTSKELHVAPLLLMVPATLAASCAFMLPVATPPNAIVFGSGRLRIADMVRAGIWLNLIGTAVIVATFLLLGEWAFGAGGMAPLP